MDTIERLDLNSNDLLVMTTDQHLSAEQSAEIRKRVETRLKEAGFVNPILILSSGMKLHVLRKQAGAPQPFSLSPPPDDERGVTMRGAA
jgi:hypothetical protein